MDIEEFHSQFGFVDKRPVFGGTAGDWELSQSSGVVFLVWRAYVVGRIEVTGEGLKVRVRLVDSSGVPIGSGIHEESSTEFISDEIKTVDDAVRYVETYMHMVFVPGLRG